MHADWGVDLVIGTGRQIRMICEEGKGTVPQRLRFGLEKMKAPQ